MNNTYISHIYQSAKRVWTSCDNAALTVQKPHTGNNCKWNQFALLNLNMKEKDNDALIFNPKNNMENMNTHIRKHIRPYS